MMENRSGGVNKGEGGVVSNKQKVRRQQRQKGIGQIHRVSSNIFFHQITSVLFIPSAGAFSFCISASQD